MGRGALTVREKNLGTMLWSILYPCEEAENRESLFLAAGAAQPKSERKTAEISPINEERTEGYCKIFGRAI